MQDITLSECCLWAGSKDVLVPEGERLIAVLAHYCQGLLLDDVYGFGDSAATESCALPRPSLGDEVCVAIERHWPSVCWAVA